MEYKEQELFLRQKMIFLILPTCSRHGCGKLSELHERSYVKRIVGTILLPARSLYRGWLDDPMLGDTDYMTIMNFANSYISRVRRPTLLRGHCTDTESELSIEPSIKPSIEFIRLKNCEKQTARKIQFILSFLVVSKPNYLSNFPKVLISLMHALYHLQTVMKSFTENEITKKDSQPSKLPKKIRRKTNHHQATSATA